MEARNSLIECLNTYIETRLFTSNEYDGFVMIPNDYNVRNNIKGLIKICVDEIIIAINANKNEGYIKKLIKDGINRFNKLEYDTEDREFICSCFQRMSQILNINIAYELNSWLYGKVLSTILKTGELLKKLKTVEIRNVECSNCNSNLQIEINSRASNIPDFWLIVRCNNCENLELVSTGTNVKRMDFKNCQYIESYEKDKYEEDFVLSNINQFKSK